MKVLLCTFTVGEGLNKICQAVSGHLTKLNIENEIFDVYQNNKKLSNFISKTYYSVVKVFPRTLRFFQIKLNNYNRDLTKQKNYNLIKRDIDALSKILPEKYKEFKFDVLYTPVLAIALGALILKRKKLIDCKVVYNVPDFNIPVYTELVKDIDKIITPCDEVDNNLKSINFNESQIAQMKIPVNQKFLEKKDAGEIRKAYNIDSKKFVVLVMTGGAGFGKTCDLLNVLCKKTNGMHFIVVNGRNEIEKNKIDKLVARKKYNNVTNLGFTKNVDELMTISDVVFTKVGAATMCEAFAKDLPIVTTKQLLYPEYDNLRHLAKKKAAISCDNIYEIAKTLTKLQNEQLDIKQYKENLAKIFDINSAEKIAKLISEMETK